jgi:hypothetical protein
LAHTAFQLLEGVHHLFVDFGRHGELIVEVDVAHLRRNCEAGRYRQLGPAHFGQSGAFATERVFHLSIAVGGSVAERIDILCHA